MATSKALGNVFKLRDIINVKDPAFGAKGDGVSDDTVAIKAAIASGYRVYFPTGTYLISSGLTMSLQAIWYGDGPRKSIIKQATNFTAITVDGITGFAIRDLQIWNSQASAAVTSGDAIKLTGASAWGVLSDLYINNCYNGVHVAFAPILRAYNVDIQYFKNAGWLFDGGTNYDAYIYGGVVDGALSAAAPVTQNGTYSIRLVDMCEEIVFHAGVFNGCVNNLSTTAAAYGLTTRPAYCRFTNCSFDNSTAGLDLDKCVDMSFVGCWISNRGSFGAIVGSTNSDGVSFGDCTFANNSGYGCLVQGAAKRTSFDSCKIVGNSASSVGTFHGLIFGDTCTDFSVTNCTITNGWGLGTQGFGIVINGTTHDRYIIRGNNLTGNATGALSDGTTTVNPDRVIRDNIGFLTRNQGVGSILSGTTALVVNHGLAVTPVAKNISISFTQNPTNDPGNSWVDTITATQFTVNVRNNPGASNLGFTWTAEYL